MIIPKFTSRASIWIIFIISGQNIENESFGFMIKNLPMLSYLSLRKCYEVDNNYLMKAVKQSKSPCLKINTWEGMITWKYATKECRLDKWMNGGKFFLIN